MTPIIYSLIASSVVMLVSLSGIIFASRKLGGWMEKNLEFLVTFSIGIFAVITWGLFGEALENGKLSIVIVSVIIGAVLVKLLSVLIPEAHHHHDPHPTHSHSRIDARKIIMGDALHNIGDGLLLVPAFIADTRLGIATTAGILLHELVQEISEYFILRESGYTMREALLRNFFASGTIFIGTFLAISLVSIESLHTPLIGLSAGGFLYILLRDLLPHTVDSIKAKGKGERHLQALVLGILIMLGIQIMLPHQELEPQGVTKTELAYKQN